MVFCFLTYAGSRVNAKECIDCTSCGRTYRDEVVSVGFFFRGVVLGFHVSEQDIDHKV